MGVKACRGLWGLDRDYPGDIPDHYGDSPVLVCGSRVFDSGGADHFCTQSYHTPCLRFGGGNHINRDGSISGGLRPWTFDNHPGPKSGP